MRGCRVNGAVALVALAAAGVGCGGDDSSGPPSVSGVVTFRDQPVAGAHVTIAGAERTTGSDGTFTFEAVPAGPQVLEARLDVDTEKFVVQRKPIVVAGDVDGERVVLPEPVAVRATDAAPDAIRLEWSPFAGSGFREYRIYQGARATVETSDLLMYIGTDPAQTSQVVHPLGVQGDTFGGSTVFFRVFVMDETGKLAGSNIETVVVPRWGPEIARPYQLRQVQARALADAVGGMTWDGAHLWIAYYRSIGDWTQPTETSLVELDLDTGAELRRFTYSADYATPWGLAWTDGTLWLAYDAGSAILKCIDPATGAVLQTARAVGDVRDLAWDGTYLLVQGEGPPAYVERIDPATRLLGPGIDAIPMSGDRYGGIAYRPGELWVSSLYGPDLVILDPTSGTPIAVVDDPRSGWSFLEFIGERLAIASSSTLFVYDVLPAPGP